MNSGWRVPYDTLNTCAVVHASDGLRDRLANDGRNLGARRSADDEDQDVTQHAATRARKPSRT
eukprot:COSAG02_NODE_3305_length_6966_cov_3.711664_10_plen_63_part_00